MTENSETSEMVRVAGQSPQWASGVVPIAIVMISLNEGHNMTAVLENIKGFAAEVFLVDSYSSDETVDIALAHGVHVVQRKFRGFGDQWNFAMSELPITAPWTMKLDPDERLTDELKKSIRGIIEKNGANAFTLRRRLWFMNQPLHVIQVILRGWKTGTCHFSDVLVNEHPLVEEHATNTVGFLEHHDSPDLHHWFEKQNRYSSAEALSTYRGSRLAFSPRLFGNQLERRMWVKSKLMHMPFRSLIVFLYSYLWQGSWRAGRVGLTWSRMRSDVYRMRARKLFEMRLNGRELSIPASPAGQPHPRVQQF
ncbi:glycosyltransferase family 2 protein [Pseudochrobactrum kiredjianiae]|uniref:Glycosyltransferase family 2 protein n=1 Tax=Pseudochrobactrum kiredjianiae TaxID=386305 RepID=A0ABW3UYA6_9HYPH|nr:glycosyltransferase family 2 protein [Pseudochrobactrum kiredjianiae]MDM7852520.1 glycosyltransferase family 2 protein [Pseudochrobactrum kiredjianiae]